MVTPDEFKGYAGIPDNATRAKLAASSMGWALAMREARPRGRQKALEGRPERKAKEEVQRELATFYALHPEARPRSNAAARQPLQDPGRPVRPVVSTPMRWYAALLAVALAIPGSPRRRRPQRPPRPAPRPAGTPPPRRPRKKPRERWPASNAASTPIRRCAMPPGRCRRRRHSVPASPSTSTSGSSGASPRTWRPSSGQGRHAAQRVREHGDAGRVQERRRSRQRRARSWQRPARPSPAR